MNRESNRLVKDLFEAANELPAPERLAWLAKQHDATGEVYDEVARLLRASCNSGDFLAEPARKREQPPVVEGDTVGSYRVLSELGAGGMGIVYLAVRSDEVYHRLAALKVIRPGLRSDPLVRRFIKERQILAQLDHTNIARIIDGGETTRGLPYFVMDYVDGLPINVFCARRCATLTQRLNLFRQTCDAVQYLHDNQIIHRDLKPANLLVTQAGLVKVIDFGIAKQIGIKPGETTGPLVATLDYASPEQILSRQLSKATDVYSLGTILYEILTGVCPSKLAGKSFPEILKAAAETEPCYPSEVLHNESQIAIDGELTEIKLRLAGDLDAIVMMALRKEPERRYASPSDFAADIVRFQRDIPVMARRNSRLYVAGKTLKRFGMRIAAALVVAASLGVGGLSTWRAIHYRNEIEKIQTEVETMREHYAPQLAVVPGNAKVGAAAGRDPGLDAGQQSTPNPMPVPVSNPELSEDLNLLASNLQSTVPAVLSSPLAPRRLTRELVQQSLELFTATAPEAIKDPAAAAALGRAYLAVSQVQWSPRGTSLNEPAQAAKSCEKALLALNSSGGHAGNQQVRHVALQLLGALNRIPPSD